MKEEHICSLCNKKFIGIGNNPEPIKKYEERCCDECNEKLVIPARLGLINENKKEKNDNTRN